MYLLCFLDLGRLCEVQQHKHTGGIRDDRMWLEAKLEELPHTALSDYLCVFHIHTHATAKKLLSLRHAKHIMRDDGLFFPHSMEKWNIECRKWGEREGRHTKLCQTPSGQIWHCVIQSCAPHPTWSLLNTLTHSPTHNTHCLIQHSNSICIHATKPKILFFFILNFYHLLAVYWKICYLYGWGKNTIWSVCFIIKKNSLHIEC